MCTRPVLRQPDYTKPFFLLMDTSAYGVGAVLSQEGELNPRTKKPAQHPIAYYSATFTPTERNYNIYKLELLAVLKALAHWRPHLAGTETPVTVLTDHANLTYWKEPRKVNRRLARWFGELQVSPPAAGRGGRASVSRVTGPEHVDYWFCQYISPSVAHGGLACDCMTRTL
jgi:hypothetical protein